MDAGGLAQMSHAPFNSGHGMAMPSGLASRRGGQNIKPLSFDSMKSAEIDNGVPTPRTSRSHLLAGLRTAPKTSTGTHFNNGPASPTIFAPQSRNRNSMGPGVYENVYNGPKTSLPRYGGQQVQQQPQQHQAAYAANTAYGLQYSADQVLAPPQLQLDEQIQEQMDPTFQAQIMLQKALLSEQQQKLQHQLMVLQAAAQFQGLNLGGQMQMMQQGYSNLYQQQLQNTQAMMTPVTPQNHFYSMYDPATGQQTLYVDQAQAQLQAQVSPQFVHPSQLGNGYAGMQQANNSAPRVQVSPPPMEHNKASFRNSSPPRRYDSPIENPVPLPPPSANAFRRGHKKSSSTANGNNKGGLSIATEEAPRGAGPKTASFPLTPMTAGYGPGQARAGEHPIRQPRNPPSMDELKSKPTAKHEGSKNFSTRTRRSAINNLVRAGMERRKDARSTGSTSPVSESTEELVETPLTDNDSDSGRSGSGSLVDYDDAACSLPSSRTSTGSWGAIGSDRPSSRQKVDRSSLDNTSDSEAAPGSFASLLKSANRGAKTEAVDGQRKAPMLVLTSAEKRKLAA
ncbi:hypothetical protein QBC34DRAFT_161104 [Podospora aff. communis PSN243]|uniref:Uncharacterized protein n=1 Tax=Podospora aff. communis PSN243 TaxID=3040156 RepID=A0AAV9GCL0_9PEZI|nr:hypothetical protein QBC34DRAFT_161104 [Podospora aff. communis PSN243]